MQNSYLSVVICTFNRCELLGSVLDHLRSNVAKGDEVEIVVVDNNSTDKTRSVVESYASASPFVRYVFEERQGLSFARNAGIAAATGEIVAFLDDDAFPAQGWVCEIVDLFSTHQWLMVLGGRVLPRFEVDRPEWLSDKILPLYSIDLSMKPFHKMGRRGYPVGANMVFRKSVFANTSFPTNLGRVGNSLLSGEEVYLIDELRRRGFYPYYSGNVCVEHYIHAERITKEWILNRYRWEGISKLKAAQTKSELFTKKLVAIAKYSIFLVLSRVTVVDSFLYRCKAEAMRQIIYG